MVSGYEPAVPVAGRPLRPAVPFPLSTKLTPVGRAPDSVRAAVGYPVEVTVKVPALPSVNVVLSAEVMEAAASTVRVKDWVAGLATPLVAVMVIGKEPVVEVAPARVAVPSPLSTKLTPDGRAPDSVSEGVG